MKRFMLLILAGSLLGLAACGGDDGEDPAGVAQVRFVNAVTDATSGIEVVVDDTNGGTLAYGQAMNYSTFPQGSHTFVMRNAENSAAFITQSLTLAADTSYTYVASGAIADGTGAIFTDDNAAPASGSFKIRVINASKTAGDGSFDVYITAPETDLFSVAPTVSGLAYRSASTYVSNTAGRFRIRLTRPGTKTSGQFFDGGSVTYTAGQIRTIVISNRLNGSIVHAITLNDAN